jgi:mannose-6-phosphate isomerase-like protein (cupin superfamily)
MALSFLRAPSPPKTHNASNSLTIYEDGTSSVEYHSLGSKYMMTHTIPPTHPQSGPSIIQPPFHYHIYQTEHFQVLSGTANMYFGLNPKPSAILSSGKRSTASLGPQRYHRFENASSSEVLKINISLEPEEYENESRFFRNFFGYLDDCKKCGMEPSIFQLFVFLESADTPLAVPMPVEWLEGVGVWVSWVLMVFVAWIGKYLLGYRDTYAEYYSPPSSEKKEK